jgi:hypothetical protein
MALVPCAVSVTVTEPVESGDLLRGYQVLSDQRTLNDLGQFVAHRISDDVSAAETLGNDQAVAYAHWRRDFYAAILRDIDQRPWARAEVEKFLQSAARLYRDHADYREWWH